MIYFGKKEVNNSLEQLEQEIHELNTMKINIISKSNIDFSRQQRPTAVGANKYWFNLNLTDIDPDIDKVVTVALENRAVDNWNGIFNWFCEIEAGKLGLEMWSFEDTAHDITAQLRSQKFRITYTKRG